MSDDTVCFYVPESAATNPLPDSASRYWTWITGHPEIQSWGPFNWTLQTFLRLAGAGVACTLVRTLPRSGIVIAHRDFLADDLRPGPELYIACILADRDQPGFTGEHPYAQFHIVQNLADPRLRQGDAAACVPYWPQPDLIARNEDDRFETAAYIGYDHNLAPELRTPAWTQRLASLGMRWVVPHRAQWNDYSDIDVVVAVRAFGRDDFEWKPPSKLHNAWRAGVPAILGPESAYREWRRSDLDYIEVASLREAFAAVERLQRDVELRRAMIANGLTRAAEVSEDRIVAAWRDMIRDRLVPGAQAWRTAGDEARAEYFRSREVRTSPARRRTVAASVDVAILGSGFAAYEVARTAVEQGLSVVVLERGPEQTGQAGLALSGVAYRREPIVSGGTAFGARVPAGFETLPRYVGLGGTSELWSGKWRTLDAVDFERAHGDRRWPVQREHLESFYAAVGEAYGIRRTSDPAHADIDAITRQHAVRIVEVSDQDPPLRLRPLWDALRGRAQLLCDVESVDAVWSGSGGRVEAVEFERNGERSSFLVRHVVVACGGIASIPVQHALRSGSGRPLPDRYGGFMDHPKAVAGEIDVAGPLAVLDAMADARARGRLFAFALPEDEVRRRGIGNHTVYLWPDPDGRPGVLRVVLNVEQFPEAANAVTGAEPVQVSWRVSRGTRADAEAFLDLLLPRLEAMFGRVRRRPLEYRGASHHAGALPMGDSGVLDGDLRFHDTENLYCASSAAFPLAGSANPTFTIVALARRLGMHLGGETH